MPLAALLPLLLIAPALAETELQVEALASQLQVEALASQLQGDGPAVGLALGARLGGGGPGFLGADLRLSDQASWIGRGTIGLDILGGSETLDLTLGLFLGTTGWMKPLAASAVDPTAGFELGFGLNLGPVRGRYRHLDGFRGPLEARLTEDEWRLGYEFGRVQIFGQHTRFNPGEEPRERGLGLGASLSF